MEVTYYAPNHTTVLLPNGAKIRPVNGAFVADIAFRDALETAGIVADPGSINVLGVAIDLAPVNYLNQPTPSGQIITSGVTKDVYTVLQNLPAGFTFTVVQGFSVPTGFEAGAGVTLNGAKLMTSRQGEGLRLEYVSANVFNVVPA